MKINSTFFEKIGLSSSQSPEAELQLELPLKTHLLQEDGRIHPGALSTMLDTVMGAAISRQFQSFATTINLNLSFFDLAPNENYFARTIILNKSENYVTAEGRITNQKDELIAKGIGTFKIKSTDTFSVNSPSQNP